MIGRFNGFACKLLVCSTDLTKSTALRWWQFAELSAQRGTSCCPRSKCTLWGIKWHSALLINKFGFPLEPRLGPRKCSSTERPKLSFIAHPRIYLSLFLPLQVCTKSGQLRSFKPYLTNQVESRWVDEFLPMPMLTVQIPKYIPGVSHKRKAEDTPRALPTVPEMRCDEEARNETLPPPPPAQSIQALPLPDLRKSASFADASEKSSEPRLILYGTRTQACTPVSTSFETESALCLRIARTPQAIA